MTESKTYKARQGHMIKTTISGTDQGCQTVYTVRSELVSPNGDVMRTFFADGWAAFNKADARRIRANQVRDCREAIPA